VEIEASEGLSPGRSCFVTLSWRFFLSIWDEHTVKCLNTKIATLIALEVEVQISKSLLTEIAKVELHLQESPESTYLFVDCLRLETYLDVLILKNRPFPFEIGSTKSSMALILVNFSHDGFSCQIFTYFVALIKALWRIGIRRI